MTIQECYSRMGADYDDVIRRLGKEERVQRFLLQLPDDNSYPNLCSALAAGNAEEAFRAAHSLKGICMNLGLMALFEQARDLADVLRDGKITEEARRLAEKVDREYETAMRSIRDFVQNQCV